jgi:hypothetical protein
MFCTNCGVKSNVEAKYCSNCGAAIASSTDGSSFSAPPTIAASNASERIPAKRPHVAWLILLIVFLIGAYAGLFIPLAAGQKTPPEAILNCLVLSTIFFWLIWKRGAKAGWHGGLIGAAMGLAIAFVGAAAIGFANRSQERAASEALMSAIEKFDPTGAAQLQNLQSGSEDYRDFTSFLLWNALLQAPDSAVVAFNEDRLALVETQSGVDLPKCVAFARGGGMPKLTRRDNIAMTEATRRLFVAAAGSPIAHVDNERAGSLASKIYGTADPSGVSGSEGVADDALCQIYLRMMHGIKALPVEDAALVVRYLSNPLNGGQ